MNLVVGVKRWGYKRLKSSFFENVSMIALMLLHMYICSSYSRVICYIAFGWLDWLFCHLSSKVICSFHKAALTKRRTLLNNTSQPKEIFSFPLFHISLVSPLFLISSFLWLFDLALYVYKQPFAKVDEYLWLLWEWVLFLLARWKLCSYWNNIWMKWVYTLSTLQP